MIGTKLGNRYEISGELGRGGMGVVYRAHDPLLNREVAVKLIPPMMLTPQAEERFQREAQVVAQMDHPGIVPIYDIGRHEDSLFFLMPVVKGASLRAFLNERPRSLGDVIDVAIQVADALDYSHAHGIVHRDIKPENIMVAEEEGGLRVRVMDFGLAKATSEQRLTKTGTLVGTVAYFSPEQVVMDTIDGRSDIYSLGTVLYECLAGQPPFTGEMQSILYRIVHEIARPPRAAGATISEELEGIVLRALAKDPARRYQRASEMGDALRHYRSKLQSDERARSVVLSAMMTAQVARPAATPFIGREKEVAELQRRLNAAVDGECQFVAIGGEPGIGKTRLLEEIENLARARRIRVLHGRFVEQDRAFSYQGFCEVFQEYFRDADSQGSSGERADFSDLAGDLTALFPVLGEVSEIRSALSAEGIVPGEPRRAEDRTTIYELLARTITRIGGGKPLLVVFDNLQGAEMSIEALGYVVRRLGPTPTMIAGTYRQTEVEKGHPLVKLLDGFSGDPRFLSLLLGPLSPSEHRKFVETTVGSPDLAKGLAETLFNATEANPFFTKELVRSLIDSGGMARDPNGAWSLSGEVALSSSALPATIQQTVEKRIEHLPEEMRDILSVASVLGKAFEFRDLELLAETRDLDGIVERLIYEGLIEEERESRGDRLTFSSGIVRDVLYSAIYKRKRKSLHRKYAEALEKRFEGRLERIYPLLLHHFAEGDVPEKTIEYGLESARQSLDALNPEETLRTSRTILDFLEEGADPRAEGDARSLAAAAHGLQGNVDAALRELEMAIRSYQKAKNPKGIVASMLQAAEAAWQARRIEETRRWVGLGIESARGTAEREMLARLLTLAGTVANLRGEYDKAREYLAEAERLLAVDKPAESSVPRGGRLNVSLANPRTAAEPAGIAIVEDIEILTLVFETLTTTDERGFVVPNLCERWEVGTDGTSITLMLRSDVRFSDGSQLTAADVKKSIERAVRLRSREMSAAFVPIRGMKELRAGEAGEISGIEILSGDRIQIHLTEKLPFYPALLTSAATGIMREGQSGEIIGTGPFIMRDATRDRTLLERNEKYWKGTPPALDSILFQVMPSASAIAEAFRSGTTDLARDLLPGDLEDLLRVPAFRNGLVETAKKTTYLLIFNSAGPFARSENLRRALAGAVRPHDLVWSTLGRLAQPASGIIPPGILGHDPGRRRAGLTREDALALIAADGLASPIRLKAGIHPIYQDRYRSLTDELFSIWSDLGVEVSVETHTMEEFLSLHHRHEEIDVLLTRWNADYDDPDDFTNTLFRSGSGLFARYFSSAETDELLQQARAEARPEARETLYRKFETIAAEGGSILPLFHEIDYRLAAPTVRGLRLRSNPPFVNYATVGKAEEEESASTPVAGGGVLHVPIAEDIRVLDPAYATTVERSEVIATIFDTLTRCGEGARIQPWLASDFRVENGGRRFRFHLRDGVRFHDGRPLGARDVRYTFERLLQAADSEYRSFLSPIHGASMLISGESSELPGFRIISNREFVVDLDVPLSFFPALLSNPAVSIVPEGWRAKGSKTSQLIGTGPFRVVQFEPGERIELERNAGYWRPGYPRSEGLVFRLAMPPAEILSEFKAGRLSVASDLFPADFEALRHDPELGAGYREVPRLSVFYIALNTHNGPLTDPSLRREIMGIDVTGIVRRTLARTAIVAHGLIPPGLLGYSAVAPQPAAIDPAPRADGATIELKAVVHSALLGGYSGVLREVEAALRARGFVLKIMNTTVAEFLDAVRVGAADVALGRWVADFPDADTFAQLLHSESGGILGRVCGHRDLDRLIEKGRTEIDVAARNSIYRRFEEFVRGEGLVRPLFHEQIYRFTRPEIEGLRLNLALPEVAYEDLRIRRTL